MANGNDSLKTFTPSVDEGLLDVSPSLSLDAFSAVVNPFSIENPLRTGAREEKIREELKSTHIPEFADFLLKGGVRGVGSENLDKTYAKTDNPLIKQAILRGDDFLTNSIIRNNFYGLNLDDRNLIAQAYVINARFSPFSSLGKSKEGETPKEVIAEFDKIKKDREDFNEGKITQAEYDVAKGKFYRNLTEDLSKGASRTLLGDPAFKSLPPITDPYTGKPASREAAMAAGLGPFSRGFTDIRVTDVPLLEELQLKSKYGFSPEVPDFLGPQVGVKYIPLKDQERFKVIPQRSKEGYEGFEPERTIDRLEDYIPVSDFPGAAKSFIDPTFLAGPEGRYYNPKTKEFLRTEDVYGTPPTLQGYQYDPRLIELLKMQRGEDFAQQFRKTGGLMQLAQGRDTMDIKQQTKNVAAQGRFGDSMLLHVNPAEVKGLAQAMPITINPQTGQPEAFLPFLAPILGSALGTTLLTTGGVLGMNLAPALASGIGAGLATYAQTGGSGSKALLSGLTAGFGTNAANTAAQASETAAAAQNLIATGSTPEAAAIKATQQAAANPRTATGAFEALKTAFNPLDAAGNPTFNFDQGAKALYAGAASPSGIMAGVTAGTGAIMESQDQFAADLLANEEERLRRRQAILDANPENIPLVFAKSGKSSSDFPDLTGDGKVTQADILKGRGVKLNRGRSIRRAADRAMQEAEDAMLAQINPYTTTQGGTAVPTVQREATAIPANFMPGFQPEMQYFKNLNPSATQITEGQSPQTNTTMPTPPQFFPRPFNPTETAGYRSFYGQGADLNIPMQTDPYSPVTYQEKPRFVAQPTLPVITPETPTLGPALPVTEEGVGLGALFDNLPTTGTPSVGKGAAIAETPEITEEQISDFVSQNLPQTSLPASTSAQPLIVRRGIGPTDNAIEYQVPFGVDLENKYFPTPGYSTRDTTLTLASDFAGIPAGDKIRYDSMGYIIPTQQDKAFDRSDVAGSLKRGATPSQQDILSVYTPYLLGSKNPEKTLGEIKALEDAGFALEGATPTSDIKTQSQKNKRGISFTNFVPKDQANQDEELLSKRPKDEPIETRADGGSTNFDMNDPIVNQTIKFILGTVDDETILPKFVEKYGNEAFIELRKVVLQSIVPDAQVEGMIKGNNNGGMTDDIGGMIGSSQPVAVSQDEYIIPADVVSMLGDGSSDSGAKKLDKFLDRVRIDKTGTTKQADKINKNVFPA